MTEQGFNLAYPLWLLGLLVIFPLVWWLLRSAQRSHEGPMYLYADAHLLPHLSGTRELAPIERWGRFGSWVLMWVLAIFAMAGPRWGYEDVHAFHPGNNLLVLLDISRSMQIADVFPSRLSRAKQEIQDLITINRVARIGIIAFASIPYVITPITEDMASLRNAIPYIDTDLVGSELQGSRLMNALDRAEILLNGLPKESTKTILVISDGDFDEPGLGDKLRQLASKNQIKLITLGVGTSEGGTVLNENGIPKLDDHQHPITSALNASELTRLADAGQGFYQEASFSQTDSEAILTAAARSQPSSDTDAKTRIWNEHFHLLLIPLLAILLPLFRQRVRKLQ